MTWGTQHALAVLGGTRSLFHLHWAKSIEQSCGEYDTGRLPFFFPESCYKPVRVLWQYLEIQHLSIALQAEQISWVCLRGALRVKWEQRQSWEPATWRNASEIAPMKNYRLSAAAEWHSTVAKAPVCSTCSLHIAFFGSGLGSGAPVPAAPQSSSSLYRFLSTRKGCAAHRSAAFSLIALATEHHLDPFFRNLSCLCAELWLLTQKLFETIE